MNSVQVYTKCDHIYIALRRVFLTFLWGDMWTGSEAIRRASGILLHPTSLPGRHGIGDLGMRPIDLSIFWRLAARPYGRSSPSDLQATETPLTSACRAWAETPFFLACR